MSGVRQSIFMPLGHCAEATYDELA